MSKTVSNPKIFHQSKQKSHLIQINNFYWSDGGEITFSTLWSNDDRVIDWSDRIEVDRIENRCDRIDRIEADRNICGDGPNNIIEPNVFMGSILRATRLFAFASRIFNFLSL